mgnify:CR=1 FL=1
MTEKSEKKIITIVILGAVLIISVLSILIYREIDRSAGNNGQNFAGSLPTRFDLIGAESAYYSLAGNTTTKTVELGAEYDQIDFNLRSIASGTETIIMRPSYSNEVGCGSSTDPTIAWFSRTITSDAGAITTLTGSSTFEYTSPASGKHEVNTRITNWNNRCLKVELWNNKLGIGQNSNSSTDIWLEIQGKYTGN